MLMIFPYWVLMYFKKSTMLEKENAQCMTILTVSMHKLITQLLLKWHFPVQWHIIYLNISSRFEKCTYPDNSFLIQAIPYCMCTLLKCYQISKIEPWMHISLAQSPEPIIYSPWPKQEKPKLLYLPPTSHWINLNTFKLLRAWLSDFHAHNWSVFCHFWKSWFLSRIMCISDSILHDRETLVQFAWS